MRYSRDYKKKDTIITVKNVKIGGKFFAIAAGPCAVENRDQYFETAIAVKKSGANLIRGSAYKPRTSPYSFQGLGQEALTIIRDLGEELKIPTITEVMDPRDVKTTSQHADILQVGARNMQNFELLKELAKINNPIILKRGMSATIEEWLNSAEYLMTEGNENIILCERGIRTFETITRNTLDLSIIPLIKMRTHLPIIVDPSHATGNRELITPACKAAIASNSDGLIIEVHQNPEVAMSDGPQSLDIAQFSELINQIKPILEVERKIITGTTLNLSEIRHQISCVDEDIIDLLATRMSLVPSLIEFKRENQIPIYQPEREKEILTKYANLAQKYTLNPALVQKIFDLIITEMRELQKKERV